MATAKKFVNDPANVVEEMVEGVAAAHSASLAVLKGFNVLLHRNVDVLKSKQVTLLSGGGAGHEPAHAGYVGDGMLTGAIVGGVFASPSIASILAAIRATCGPHGCLLIIKNYTGDRINFGQAALLAQAEGFKVATVVVADDCALPEGKGITGGRGVAGTVFVHKVAGAAASAGLPLEAVAAEAQAAAESVRTLGVAMTTCTVPGAPTSGRLPADKLEIGLGIHGEPGTRQSPVLPADALVDEMVSQTLSRLKIGSAADLGTDQLAIMVNNLGGTPTMELYVALRRALHKTQELTGHRVSRVLVGPFMTALEMQGMSLSLLRLDALRASRIDAPTTASAWSCSNVGQRAEWVAEIQPAAEPPPAATAAVEAGPTGGSALTAEVLMAVCNALVDAEPQLTEWDTVAGDGDCGITFKRGALQILADLPAYPLGSNAATFDALASSISSSMGGTSGALLEIFFRAGKLHLMSSPGDLAGAFAAGTDAVRSIGGADVGYRTMLDALIPAAAVLADPSTASLAAASQAANDGAEATREMAGLAGRSNYIPDELLKTVPDPGAMAIAIAFRAAVVTS